MSTKEYFKKYRESHREKINSNQREYYKTHREKISAYKREYYQTHKEKIKAYRFNHKEKNKKYHLKSLYGLSLTDFDNLLLAQNNKCPICGQPLDLQKPKNVVVDHSHKTGKVRGILCSNCNKALGFLKDNPEYAYNASIYLESD